MHCGIADQIRGYDAGRQILSTCAAALAALCVVVLTHAASDFAPALLPLYVIPVWIAVTMDGVRSGWILAAVSGVALSHGESHWGPATGLSAGMLAGTGASMGLIMLLMARVQENLLSHRRLAFEDPLTGLLNRRAFFDYVAKRSKRASKQPHVVVAIDCDHFKLLNDTYGHHVGDLILQTLGETLKAHTRPTDVVARVGGDEFALVLNGIDMAGAMCVMDRIEVAFETAAEDLGYVSTISCGFASAEGKGEPLDELLQVADRSMYRSRVARSTPNPLYLN
ncbi:hypothetical protein BH11ARM1_BH11ARM1_00900 [soil metagenome]